MATVSSISGVDEYVERLRKLAAQAKNPEALYREAGEYMVNTEIPKVFRDSGPGWDATLRGGKPLLDTGHLRDSIHYTASNSELTVGTPLIYAPVHQYGATIKAKNFKHLHFKVGNRWVKKASIVVPKRTFLVWSERALAKIKSRWTAMLANQ